MSDKTKEVTISCLTNWAKFSNDGKTWVNGYLRSVGANSDGKLFYTMRGRMATFKYCEVL